MFIIFQDIDHEKFNISIEKFSHICLIDFLFSLSYSFMQICNNLLQSENIPKQDQQSMGKLSFRLEFDLFEKETDQINEGTHVTLRSRLIFLKVLGLLRSEAVKNGQIRHGC